MNVRCGEYILNLDLITHVHFNERSKEATAYFTGGTVLTLAPEDALVLARHFTDTTPKASGKVTPIPVAEPESEPDLNEPARVAEKLIKKARGHK